LTVVTTNISFGFYANAEVAERSFEDFGIGDFGPESAEMRHWNFLFVDKNQQQQIES
jgi:hypothetical protein